MGHSWRFPTLAQTLHHSPTTPDMPMLRASSSPKGRKIFIHISAHPEVAYHSQIGILLEKMKFGGLRHSTFSGFSQVWSCTAQENVYTEILKSLWNIKLWEPFSSLLLVVIFLQQNPPIPQHTHTHTHPSTSQHRCHSSFLQFGLCLSIANLSRKSCHRVQALETDPYTCKADNLFKNNNNNLEWICTGFKFSQMLLSRYDGYLTTKLPGGTKYYNGNEEAAQLSLAAVSNMHWNERGLPKIPQCKKNPLEKHGQLCQFAIFCSPLPFRALEWPHLYVRSQLLCCTFLILSFFLPGTEKLWVSF